MGMTSNNLVIGTIYSLGMSDIRIFIESLRASYNGRIVLFVNNLHQNVRDYLLKNNVELIEAMQHQFMHINNYRFFLYKDFLEKNKADKVFLTDVRDVFFQGDPFEYDSIEGITVSLEDKNIIQTCPCNKNWVLNFYGNEIYEKIAKNKIICAGTIIGDYQSILSHISKMCSEIQFIGNKNFNLLRIPGADQTAHDVICYLRDKTYSVSFLDNKESHIMTVGNTDPSLIMINNDIIYNENGVIKVVHQYDRIESVFKKILNKWK